MSSPIKYVNSENVVQVPELTRITGETLKRHLLNNNKQAFKNLLLSTVCMIEVVNPFDDFKNYPLLLEGSRFEENYTRLTINTQIPQDESLLPSDPKRLWSSETTTQLTNIKQRDLRYFQFTRGVSNDDIRLSCINPTRSSQRFVMYRYIPFSGFRLVGRDRFNFFFYSIFGGELPGGIEIESNEFATNKRSGYELFDRPGFDPEHQVVLSVRIRTGGVNGSYLAFDPLDNDNPVKFVSNGAYNANPMRYRVDFNIVVVGYDFIPDNVSYGQSIIQNYLSELKLNETICCSGMLPTENDYFGNKVSHLQRECTQIINENKCTPAKIASQCSEDENWRWMPHCGTFSSSNVQRASVAEPYLSTWCQSDPFRMASHCAVRRWCKLQGEQENAPVCFNDDKQPRWNSVCSPEEEIEQRVKGSALCHCYDIDGALLLNFQSPILQGTNLLTNGRLGCAYPPCVRGSVRQNTGQSHGFRIHSTASSLVGASRCPNSCVINNMISVDDAFVGNDFIIRATCCNPGVIASNGETLSITGEEIDTRACSTFASETEPFTTLIADDELRENIEQDIEETIENNESYRAIYYTIWSICTVLMIIMTIHLVIASKSKSNNSSNNEINKS